MAKDLIFGYGSLMEQATRIKNGAGPYLQPARIHGYTRGWLVKHQDGEEEVVFLGSVPCINLSMEASSVNGILYEAGAEHLHTTDDFEGKGYHRVALPLSAIEMLDPSVPVPIARVWMYMSTVKNITGIPGAGYGILQSYLDTCLRGCDEIEAHFPAAVNFKKEFLATTFFRDHRRLISR